MALTPRFTVLLLRERGAAPSAQSPGPEGKGREEAVSPEGMRVPRGRGGHPERHGGAALPSGERAGRCSRPGTGYCPPLGPDRGGTHRLRPAASPAGTAPSLLAEAASGAPGSAPAGPGAQRCHSGREQPRPVFCSAGPGKRPGVAWRPPEPGVPVPGVLETGDGRAEKARSFPSRRCSLARSQPEGCGRAARRATRASAIRGGAGGEGGCRSFFPGSGVSAAGKPRSPGEERRAGGGLQIPACPAAPRPTDRRRREGARPSGTRSLR